jgi:hypothetical protein
MSYCKVSLYTIFNKLKSGGKDSMKKDVRDSSVSSSSSSSDSTQNQVEPGEAQNPIQSKYSHGIY